MAYLIGLGHVDVLNYGWGFFLLTLKAVNRMHKDMILTQAAAIGVAFGGKDSLKELK